MYSTCSTIQKYACKIELLSNYHRSLASKMKGQIQEESNPPQFISKPKRKQHTEEEILQSLGKRVSSKLEDGDFKGAVRLASTSEGSFADSW